MIFALLPLLTSGSLLQQGAELRVGAPELVQDRVIDLVRHAGSLAGVTEKKAAVQTQVLK